MQVTSFSVLYNNPYLWSIRIFNTIFLFNIIDHLISFKVRRPLVYQSQLCDPFLNIVATTTTVYRVVIVEFSVQD